MQQHTDVLPSNDHKFSTKAARKHPKRSENGDAFMLLGLLAQIYLSEQRENL